MFNLIRSISIRRLRCKPPQPPQRKPPQRIPAHCYNCSVKICQWQFLHSGHCLSFWRRAEASMVEMGGRNPPPLPPNFVTLRQLRDRRLMEAQAQNPPLGRRSMEEKSDNQPLLPPNYVSLRQLQERRLQEEKENEKESDKGPCLPPNYVSLRQLQERRLKEEREKANEKEREEEKGGKHSQLKELALKEKEAEEEAEKARLQRIEELEKRDESVQIEMEIGKKSGYLARNPRSKKPNKLGHMKSSWVWRPVLRSAGSSSGAGASSSDAVLVPENGGASRQVSVPLSDQNGNAEKKNKPMEATGLKIGAAVNASNAEKEATASRNETNTAKKGKKKKKGSGKKKVKGFNGAQAIGFKMLDCRDKGKSKEVNLSESSHGVIPVSEVANGSEGIEEVIGSGIANGRKKMGKGKTVNIPELSDRTSICEEAKGNGSEIRSGEEKGRGENVNVPESSEWRGPVGGHRRRNPARRIRGRGHPTAESFTGRAAERLIGGRSIWVPKISS